MLSALAHRGPDGEGVWSADGVHLGHRRLSIIDVENGAQPMVGDTGCVITFNGEIYNFVELRDELEAGGASFRTASDTEVLLKLYEAHGEACLGRLVGMFAFAIWDPRVGRLFLARDRLGKKPLYVFHQNGLFAFASEIKALLMLEEVRRVVEPDARALSDILSLGYVLTPKSIFKQIRKLPAAHCLWIDPTSGNAQETRYWDLASFFTMPKMAAGPDTTQRFHALLDDAVRLRLRSDVPLGGYLSGGLDSVSILQSMTKASTTPVHAFCIGFEDRSFDESRYARLAADYLHCGLTVKTQPGYTAPEVRKLVWQTDEPFADTSIGPTYSLNKEARSEVIVALSGDGADELLAGYPTHRASALHRYWRRFPRAVRATTLWLAQRLTRPSYRKVSWDYKLLKFLGGHDYDLERAHYSWRELFQDGEKRRIFTDDALAELDGYDPFATFREHFAAVEGADFLDRLLYVDIKTWLQDDILVKVDRMSMASSVEVRSPYLDHRLVEFCAQLPRAAKMDLLRQKVILRQAMNGTIPTETLKRPKRGFNAPTRNLGALRLNGERLPGIFRDTVTLDAKVEDITFKSFVFAILNEWMEMFGDYQKDGNWHG